MLGVLTVLVLLALPWGQAAAAWGQAPAAAAPIPGAWGARDLAGIPSHIDEDGACEEIEPQELLECGAQYDDMLDQPIVLSLLRALGVRLTADTCNELLADLWAKQICEIGSLDCGRMNAGGPPGPPLELVSGSSSGHSSWAQPSNSAMSGTGLSAFADQTIAFDSRELQPPVPPPR